MSSIGEGNVTFWQRLKRQKNGLGNIALASSTLLLAMRLIDQDKELERMKAGESSLVDALRRENRSLQEKFAAFRAAVEEEIGRAGSRLPPLSTRLQNLIDIVFKEIGRAGSRLPPLSTRSQNLIEKSKREDPLPLISHEGKRGQESEALQSQAKGKSNNFMV